MKHKFLPTGLRIGTDLISIIQSNLGEKFNGWEVNTDVDIYRYYITFDYGSWSRHTTIPTGNYENSGNYFRVGTDINFLLKDPDRNMFFLGFRYAQNNFSEQLNYESTDVYNGTVQHELQNNNMTGRWGELTAGLRVKIWKGFWMGYTARLKTAPATKGEDGFEPYEIPGYGLAAKKTSWGFNYQIFWRIPLRKI